MGLEDLAEKIFMLDYKLASSEDDSPKVQKKYVQIKRQSIMMGMDENQILQLIDISDQIMCNIVQGEKKLLSIINATVSHEMRNPLNSIYSQNLKQ
jgi:signal transduction histidine kinase